VAARRLLGVVQLLLALVAAGVAGFIVHELRGYPWRTTLYTAFAVGALTFVAVRTLERLILLIGRERHRGRPE